MAILTGPEIINQVEAGAITIDPFVPDHCGPNSVDLRLHEDMLVYKVARAPFMRQGYVFGSENPRSPQYLDMRGENPTAEKLVIPESGLVLLPGVLYLARTVERVGSEEFVPIVEGRSSVGRLGVQVHVTAGFCDLGFEGTITLEITVVHPVKIYPGERICQVYFEESRGEKKLYSGRYQGQVDPTASRMHQK